MDIVEFLTARYAEDEAAAQKPWGKDWRVDGPPGRLGVFDADHGEPLLLDAIDDGTAYFCEHFQPRRMLADIAAKRGIVAEHAAIDDGSGIRRICRTCAGPEGFELYSDDYPCRTLRLLAAPHAAHPDFDEAWKIDG